MSMFINYVMSRACDVTLQDLPFDVSLSVFVLHQALSVRALQEMISAKSTDAVSCSFLADKISEWYLIF